MKYKDEFQIAGTALLLCGVMLAISIVTPKGNSTSTASTIFKEAPETAAEAEKIAEEAAREAGFPIYIEEIYSDNTASDSINFYDPAQENSGITDSSQDTDSSSGQNSSPEQSQPTPDAETDTSLPSDSTEAEPPTDIGQIENPGSDVVVEIPEDNSQPETPDNSMNNDTAEDVSGNSDNFSDGGDISTEIIPSE